MSNNSGQVVKDLEFIIDGKVVKFQVVLLADTTTPPPPPPPEQAQLLSVLNVITSADDGNKGANMLKDDNTRWSCKGKDCTATFDLGAVQEVGRIQIRFFKDAERTENFEIGISENGTKFTTISESQQGQAAAIINITPSVNARYVRGIFKGNNVNDWNSVEHFAIYGKQLVDPPPVKDCPPGYHHDPTTGDCVQDSTGPSDGGGGGGNGSNIIEDSVKMMYPKVGQAVQFKYSSSNEGRAQWVANLPKCFVDIETTFYIKLKKVTNKKEEISVKHRGGPHSGNNDSANCPEDNADNCKGCNYIHGIGYDGSVNAQYECPHPKNHPLTGYDVITPNVAGSDIVGKWIGVKAITFLEGDHDHLECWIDPDGLKADGTPANNWKKFWEGDSKQFTGRCNGKGDERVYIRCDDVQGAPKNPEAEIDFASTREIVVTPTKAKEGVASLMAEDTKSPKIGRDLAKHQKWGDIKVSPNNKSTLKKS